MSSHIFRGLETQDRYFIKMHLRLMTVSPWKVISLEHIRANPYLHLYSDAAIYSCIELLVDEGWLVLTEYIPNSYQLRNGYIYRQE